MMKKWIGILFAVVFCMTLTASAMADMIAPPDFEIPTEEATDEPTDAPTDAPMKQPDTDAPDSIVIAPAAEGEDDYKDLLMDTFRQTSLASNASIRAQIQKILYRDEITVTAENYTHIVVAVNKALKEGKLSEGASLDRYTDEDLKLAVELIDSICDELGVDYSIDPSNDSQNEYARVITITKNGKVLGKINSDAKTDVGDRPSLGWIIGGGVLMAAAAAFGIALVAVTSRKKRSE